MTLVTVPCAVCGGSVFDPLYASTISDLALDPSMYFSSSRRRVGHLAIVRCRECHLVMTNPRDDDETLSRVYRGLEDRVYASEAGNRTRTAEEHLRFVTAHHPRANRLLDVGCATGTFVCRAAKAGWRATGLDASEWAIAYARERCPNATFVAGLMEEADFEPASFGVVTLWDVIEHVRSPAETLVLARRWLKPHGSLFLNMPNVDSFVARAMGSRWILLLREHLWYFSPKSMTALLRQNGFELIGTRENFVRFSVANIAGRVAQCSNAFGRVAGRSANIDLLKRLALRFPIGEMNVAARRVG